MIIIKPRSGLFMIVFKLLKPKFTLCFYGGFGSKNSL